MYDRWHGDGAETGERGAERQGAGGAARWAEWAVGPGEAPKVFVRRAASASCSVGVAVVVAAAAAAAVRTASSTAISQKGFIDIFTFASSTPFLSAAMRT